MTSDIPATAEKTRVIAKKLMGWRLVYFSDGVKPHGYRDQDDEWIELWKFRPFTDANHLRMCLEKLFADHKVRVDTRWHQFISACQEFIDRDLCFQWGVKSEISQVLLLPIATQADLIYEIVKGE